MSTTIDTGDHFWGDDEEEPRPAHCFAWLFVRSERLSDEELEVAVGVPPDERWTKGVARNPERHPEIRDKLSGLRYKSRLPETDGLPDLLQEVLDRLRSGIDRLGALALEGRRSEAEGGRLDPSLKMLLSVVSWETDLDIFLEPEQLEDLARMGATVELAFTWDRVDDQNGVIE